MVPAHSNIFHCLVRLFFIYFTTENTLCYYYLWVKLFWCSISSCPWVLWCYVIWLQYTQTGPTFSCYKILPIVCRCPKIVHRRVIEIIKCHDSGVALPNIFGSKRDTSEALVRRNVPLREDDFFLLDLRPDRISFLFLNCRYVWIVSFVFLNALYTGHPKWKPTVTVTVQSLVSDTGYIVQKYQDVLQKYTPIFCLEFCWYLLLKKRRKLIGLPFFLITLSEKVLDVHFLYDVKVKC